MKIDYEDLIEKLKRTGQMYYPSNQSYLCYRAADAIEELLKDKLTLMDRIKLIFRRKDKHN